MRFLQVRKEKSESWPLSLSLSLSLSAVGFSHRRHFPSLFASLSLRNKNKTFSQPNQQSFVDTHQLRAYFPNKWGEISLTVYLAVSVTMTHSFPSGWHGGASSPGAARRKTPTCPRWSQPVLGNARQLILLTLYRPTGEWMITRETAEVLCVGERKVLMKRPPQPPSTYVHTIRQLHKYTHAQKYTDTSTNTVCKLLRCLRSARCHSWGHQRIV